MVTSAREDEQLSPEGSLCHRATDEFNNEGSKSENGQVTPRTGEYDRDGDVVVTEGDTTDRADTHNPRLDDTEGIHRINREKEEDDLKGTDERISDGVATMSSTSPLSDKPYSSDEAAKIDRIFNSHAPGDYQRPGLEVISGDDDCDNASYE